MKYIHDQIQNFEQALAAKPIRVFVMKDLSELDGIVQGIYIIEDLGRDQDLTFEKMKAYKAKRDRACPRLNHPSRILYVGSSTTGLKSRIRQHTNSNNKSTSALHLGEWFEGEYEITIRVFDAPKEIVQILEDAHWHELRPAFGQPGGNNK